MRGFLAYFVLWRKHKLLLFSNIIKVHKINRNIIENVEELIERHFENWSIPTHINRVGLSIALSLLKGNAANILETGTSAYGVDSSRLFDSYIRNFGGNFLSVDLDHGASKNLYMQTSSNSKFFVDDSVNFFLNTVPKLGILNFDLVYLDSWDVDWSNPEPSAVHGLREFKAIENYLATGAILLIDDTPNSLQLIPKEFQSEAVLFYEKYGVIPGKGAFVYLNLKLRKDVSVIYHKYNIIFKFN